MIIVWGDVQNNPNTNQTPTKHQSKHPQGSSKTIQLRGIRGLAGVVAIFSTFGDNRTLDRGVELHQWPRDPSGPKLGEDVAEVGRREGVDLRRGGQQWCVFEKGERGRGG